PGPGPLGRGAGPAAGRTGGAGHRQCAARPAACHRGGAQRRRRAAAGAAGHPAGAAAGTRRVPCGHAAGTRRLSHTTPQGSANAVSSTLHQYFELTRPRVVALIVFTAIVGMLLATPGLPPWDALVFG